MLSYRSRVGRAGVVLMLAMLHACVDEPPVTGPAPAGGTGTSCDVDPCEPRAPIHYHSTVGDVITVTTTSDANLPGTLRWAIEQAQNGDRIQFDPGLSGRTIVLSQTLQVNRDITIEGPADRGITISGDGKGRVFELAIPLGKRLTLRNLGITGGFATGSGAAILGQSGVTLENSTVWGNEAGGFGSIYVLDLKLINSTVSSNLSTDGYVAIVASNFEAVNSTVAHNSSGGVGFDKGVLRNSIIARNGTRPNCTLLAVTHDGTSLSDDASCGGPAVMLIADPELAALADNGGPGMTHAIGPASPAYDAATDCTVSVDQRHWRRDAPCDIGAFEYVDSRAEISVDGSVNVNPNTGWAVVTGTVRCTRSEVFDLKVDLAQAQKAGRTATVVAAAAQTPVACSTSPRPWSAVLAPSSGAFKNGSATASMQTINTPVWVLPADASSEVRLFWGHK